MTTIGRALLAGAGGGKGEDDARRSPTESPDTLRSLARARVLDLLCEGEIGGLLLGLKSVFFDGVPVQAADGSYNFKDVTVYDVKGTQTQEYIPDFPAAETETTVNVQVTNGSPVTRTISGSAGAVDAVRVTIEVPQLTLTDSSTGNVGPNTRQISIQVQSAGGGYVTQSLNGAEVISGKCTSPYEKQYRIELTGSGPWDVRVSRVTANDSGGNVGQTWWKSYTVVTDDKLAYPNSALCAVEVSAHQFQSIPTRSYLIKGLKISLPNNYDQASRSYVGDWGGTFAAPAWSDNPAWCLYDMLTSARYGLGLPASSVDKWGLYSAALQCDARVRRGDSFYEGTTTSYDPDPVFFEDDSANLTSSAGGPFGGWALMVAAPYKWTDYGFAVGMEIYVPSLDDGLGTGSGNFIVGEIVSLVDDNDTIYLYPIDGCSALSPYLSDQSVLGVYATARTEPRFRCNLYLQEQADAYQVVNNLASIFRAMAYWSSGSVTAVMDVAADAVALYSAANVVEGRFTYVGTARRARHTSAEVQWNDPANGYRSTREYVTDEDAVALYGYNPAPVVALGCTSRGQAQRVGRWLLACERLEKETVTFRAGLDAAFLTPGAIIKVADSARAGKRYSGRAVSATATTIELDADVLTAGTPGGATTLFIAAMTPAGTVEEHLCVNTPGSRTYTLASGASWTSTPQAEAVWVARDSSLVPTAWRVLTVVDQQDGTFEVTALRHDAGKYASENDVKIDDQLPVTSLPPSTAPQSLTVGENLYAATNGGVSVMLTARWNQIPEATAYRVRWRAGSGNWSEYTEQKAQYWELVDIRILGAYTVQVSAVINGLETQYAEASHTVAGKTAAPSNVTGFEGSPGPTGIQLEWDQIADLDRDQYEIRVGGANWAGATFVWKGTALKFFYKFPLDAASGTYTFRIKAIDTSGNPSSTDSTVAIEYTNAFDGGDLSNGVGQSDGVAVRILTRGHIQFSARNGDSVTFPVNFQNPPLVMFEGGINHEPRSKWGTTGDGSETGAVDTTKPQYKDFRAVNLTASGFTMRARLRQKATQTAGNADADSVNNLLTSQGSTAAATLNNAASGAVADTYVVHYLVTVTAQAEYTDTVPPQLQSDTATLVVAIETSADGGTTWVERATYTYTKTTTSTSGATTTWSHEAKTVVVSGLSSNATADKIRIKAKSFSSTTGNGSFTAHLFAGVAATPDDPEHGLTYATASDQYASATPDSEDAVTVDAVETN